MSEMQVEVVPIDSLTTDPKNVRKHGPRNLDAIKRSLERFGQRRALIVMPDGTVIAGNGTLEAARALGWTDISVTRVPADWTTDEAAAYAIADNRTAELAEWDDDVLKDTLADLDSKGWDIADVGFDVNFLPPAEVHEDDVPSVPVEPETKPGDLWVLGDHRLLCGDSTVITDVEKVMGGGVAALCITDPPYNVDYQSGDGKTIKNDHMKAEAFVAFLTDAFTSLYAACSAGTPVYVFHADSEGLAFRTAFTAAGFLLKQVLVWAKQSFVLGRQDYHWQHEPILYGWKPGAAHRWFGGRKLATVIGGESLSEMSDVEVRELLEEMLAETSVIKHERPSTSAEHPTMKPVALVARLLENSSLRGDVVVDPFLGSGTTLIACEQTGRVCRGLELDPAYCDVIVQRWENLTGKKAHIDGATEEGR